MCLKVYKKREKGIAMLFAVLVASLVLMIGLSIFNITFTELVLSAQIRDSQFAFYAADTALECALFWDVKHTGLTQSAFGGFPSVTTINDDLVSYWALNEESGTTASDSSAAGNNGTLVGTMNGDEWTSAQIGNGLTFDGSAGVVRASDLDFSDEISGSLWVKFNNLSGKQFLLAQVEVDANIEWQLQMQGDVDRTFRIRIDTADGNKLITDSSTSASTAWTHVAWTYDDTDLRLYINGTEESNVVEQTGSGAIQDTNQLLHIGGRRWSTPPQYQEVVKGIIDEIRIYDRVLTSEEIDALSGQTNFQPPVARDSDLTCDGEDITAIVSGWDDTAGWDRDISANGATTTFDMEFANGRCANVLVAKSDTAGTRIESRGYNTCNLDDPRRVERALRVTY